VYDGLHPHVKYQIGEYGSLLKTVMPIKSSDLTSKDLILQKRKTSNTFEQVLSEQGSCSPLLTYNVVFPKDARPVEPLKQTATKKRGKKADPTAPTKRRKTTGKKLFIKEIVVK
jgi:hypothetical protein